MKKISYSIYLLLFVLSNSIYGQNLTIVNGTSLAMLTGAKLHVHGLEFIPSANFLIDGPITLTRSSSAIDPQSINRVFETDNLIVNFQGTLNFYYKDIELNGVTESDLVLQVRNGSGFWNSFSGVLDTNMNSLSYGFGSPTNFNLVTASANGATLFTQSLSKLEVKIYPNPVTSYIYIDSKLNVRTSIYNVTGQKILNTDKKQIDLTGFSNGTYLFEIKDESTQVSNSYKIIKN